MKVRIREAQRLSRLERKCYFGGGGSSGGGGQNTNTVTKQELPAYAQPAAEQVLARGSNLSNQPYQAYPGQQIADMSPETQQGLSMQTNRAMYGAPELNASRNMLTATARGDFMDPQTNPYFNTYMNEVQGRVNNQFNKPGAFGGSANQELMTRNLGETAGQFYDAERSRQMQAAQLAPQTAATDYTDIQNMLQAGDVYGQRSQDLLNQQYNQWMEQLNYPYQQLDVLGNALAASTGGRSTTIQQQPAYQYNRAASAAGGGLLGYGLGSAAQGQLGQYAPMAGAGLGALGGYFM